jgi:MFS family permease
MSTTYIQKLRLFNRDVRLYLTSWALMGFGYQGIFLVLCNIYLLRLGYGPEFIGLVSGLGMFSFALCSLPAGALGRRWGSRRMMISGMALMTVGFWLLPSAEIVSGNWRSVWIVTAWCLVSFSAPLFTVNGSPFLMAATTPEVRDHAFSVQTALMPLAGVAGSLVGGALPGLFSQALAVPLDQPAPYRYTLFLVGAAFLVGLLATLATRETSPVQERHGVSKSASSSVGPLPVALISLMGLVMALRTAGEFAANTFFNVYLDSGLNVRTLLIGVMVAGAQLMGGIATLSMPLLAKRWGKERIIGLGSIGVAVGLVPLALVPHWAAAGVGLMGTIGSATIVTASIFIYGQELVTPSWRAVMSGAIWMGVGIGGAAIVIGGGQLIAASGYTSLFLTAAGLAAAGGLLFWSYFRLPRGELARNHVPEDQD